MLAQLPILHSWPFPVPLVPAPLGGVQPLTNLVDFDLVKPKMFSGTPARARAESPNSLFWQRGSPVVKPRVLWGAAGASRGAAD